MYTYDSDLGGTINSYLRTQLGELVVERLQARRAGAARVGYQREFMPGMLAEHVNKGLGGAPTWVDVDEQLHQMQEVKDEDEIALIRKAVQVDLAAYDAAQKAIVPGVLELDVLGSAQHAAHLAAGERVFTMATTRAARTAASPATAPSKRASSTSSTAGPPTAATGRTYAARFPSASLRTCRSPSSPTCAPSTTVRD